jgi:hypothetical protein
VSTPEFDADPLVTLRDLLERTETLEGADEVARGHCWAERRATRWSPANRDMRLTNDPPRRPPACRYAIPPRDRRLGGSS